MTDKVIIIRETWAQSLISDLGTLAMFCAMLGLGVWLDSAAMQWVGGVLFLFAVISFATAKSNGNRCTIAEARTRLDEMEAEHG